MALLLLSNRSITRAGVRAVTMREVVGLCALACLIVGALSLFAGIAIGRFMQPDTELAQHNDPLRDGFALQRLGEMSARMMTLENNASTLLRKLSGIEQIQGNLNKLEKAGVAPHIGPVPEIKAVDVPGTNPAPRAAAGGPELPPLCNVNQLGSAAEKAGERVRNTEGALNCLQTLLDRIEKGASSHTLAFMTVPNRPPVLNVELGSPFGNRIDPITGAIAFHPGLDFAAPPGTDILAAGGGRVRFAGFQNELGNVVEIDHGNGLVSRYAHASRLFVKQGDIVAPGQKISAVGSTGRSTGPHLHFEVLNNGRYVDPMKYLSGLPPEARHDAILSAKQ